jgi:hypothetical protein
VNIIDRVATITAPSSDWSGAETITFRATDPGDLYNEDSAAFTANTSDTTTIQGVTYEVNGNVLGGVTVTIDGGSSVVSGTDGSYQINVTLGTHNVVASKTGYRSQTVSDFSAAEAGESYTLNFHGNDGLMPSVVSQSYLLACVSKYRLQPGDGTAINQSKLLRVVNAYKNPIS